MNGHPMPKARAALALHPRCAGLMVELQDAPAGTPAQDLAGDSYAVWLGVLRPRGRSRGSAAGLFAFGQIAEEILAALLRGREVGKGSGINPQFRHLRGLPGQTPMDPSTGRPIRVPA